MNKVERVPWDQYFMIRAKITALRSSCNSRPGGAVIVKNNRVLSTGYVGSPEGVDQCSDNGVNYCYRRSLDIPDYDKYNFCRSIHAEQNAICYAANYGISLTGSTLYCTLQPCIICVKLINASGIKRVCFEHYYDSKDTKRDKLWDDRLKEYNIECDQVVVEDKWKKLACDFINTTTSMRILQPTD